VPIVFVLDVGVCALLHACCAECLFGVVGVCRRGVLEPLMEGAVVGFWQSSWADVRGFVF
jgi:hypothetical protein